MNYVASNPFLQAFRGSFLGLRKWEDLDTFWEILRKKTDDHWFIYAIGESVPESPASSVQLLSFIEHVNSLLRREHQEDYCGIVYVDDPQNPAMIKIYDPNNLGVVCGFSNNPPLPGWIISRLQPVELSSTMFLPQNRRRWWQRLFSSFQANSS